MAAKNNDKDKLAAAKAGKDNFQRMINFATTEKCKHMMISKNFGEDGFICGKNCDFCVFPEKVKDSIRGLGSGGKSKTRLDFGVDESDELYGGGRKGMKSAMADYMTEKTQIVFEIN